MIVFFNRHFLRFLLAGGINTIFGYLAYGSLILLGLIPAAALLGGFMAGTVFNFFSTGTVFASYSLRRLPRFLAVYIALFAINAMLLHRMIYSGIGPLLAQALLVPAFVPANFLAMRRFVFAPDPESAS